MFETFIYIHSFDPPNNPKRQQQYPHSLLPEQVQVILSQSSRAFPGNTPDSGLLEVWVPILTLQLLFYEFGKSTSLSLSYLACKMRIKTTQRCGEHQLGKQC